MQWRMEPVAQLGIAQQKGVKRCRLTPLVIQKMDGLAYFTACMAA
jgi:hypothetical protein